MTTKDKAFALIRRIRSMASEGHTISFHGDFGNDLTILVDDQHTHTYNGRTKTDEEMVDELYATLKYPLYD
jgi:hypothetical protein